MARRHTFISTPVAHLVGPGKLKVINGRLAFATGQDGPLRLDPAGLRTVLCYGKVGVTDEAVDLLLRHAIQVSWLTPSGNRCHGRLTGSDPSTTLLRICQHQVFLHPPFQLALAKSWVGGKIRAQIHAGRHFQRQSRSQAGSVLAILKSLEASCQAAGNLDALRGIEGAASAAWFNLFGQLVRPPFIFEQRRRRPPPDPVNALLSLGYTLLHQRAESRCGALGLEVNLGTLHAFHPGRASLACDVIEPLRVPAVDRWVLELLNQNMLAPEDFFIEPQQGCLLQKKALPRILVHWETHWSQGGHEPALDQSLEQLTATIRLWARQLPVLRASLNQEG